MSANLPDPDVELVRQLLVAGFRPIPQVATGVTEHSLMRAGEGYVDIMTLPTYGDATVVRIVAGAWDPSRPRDAVHEVWRRHVPVGVAGEFLLSEPRNDSTLTPPDKRDHLAATDKRPTPQTINHKSP
jgi:hypothetical protein